MSLLPSLPPTPNRHNTAPSSTSFLTPSRPTLPPPVPTPVSAPAAPPPPPQHPSIHLQAGSETGSGDLLQRHMQACFLAGSCADVRLRVDRWNRVYKLHKVVLIQAGYFESLFCSDFAEGQDEYTSGGADGAPVLVDDAKGWARSGESEIDLRMEDPNISRAAFEILIARLYLTGPALHLSPETHPTAQCPLSPAFPFLPAASSPAPSSAQPASPRFLLSLLATSIFLGMPGVTHSVMDLVIGNVSPWSVNVYLGFAIGRGIGSFGGEAWEDEAGAKAAVGLESIGKVPAPWQRKSNDLRESDSREGIKTESPTPMGPSPKSAAAAGTSVSHPVSPSPSTSSSSSSSIQSDLINSLHSVSEPEPAFFYGLTSSKIGEACAVWLCKWGRDVLDVEERTHAIGVLGVEEHFGGMQLGSGDRTGEKIQGSTTGLCLAPGPSATPVRSPSSSTPTPVVFPPVFSFGGLSASWIRAIISSDAFFVKSELERYKVARRVYELRRAQLEAHRVADGRAYEDDEDREEAEEEDEDEFERLFSGGILYAHMSFDELAFISQDLCPSSGMPYAPLPVLQTSLWQHQELQSRILASVPSSAVSGPLSPGSASSSSSVDGAEELGLAESALDITRRIERARQKEYRRLRRRSRSLSRPTAAAMPTSLPPTPSKDKGKQRQSQPDPRPGASISSTASAVAGLGTGGGLASLESRRYWPVPADDTHRLGAWGGFVDLADPEASPVNTLSLAVADLGPRGPASLNGGPPAESVSAAGVQASLGAENEDTFFGIGSKVLTGAEVAAGLANDGATDDGPTFTGYEPYRWGVEFFDVGQLKEKQRLYSETRAYGGNTFNVYVQQVRRKDKGLQCGLYIHRQSPHEPIPPASAPPARHAVTSLAAQSTSPEPGSPQFGGMGALFEPASFSSSTGGSSLLGTSPVPLSRTYSTLNPSSAHPSAPPPATVIPTTSTSPPERGPVLVFRDARKTIKLWFSLTCCSSLGTAQTCFASAPDLFLGSQSWGFRSSSLRSQEYLSSAEGNILPEEDTLVWSGHLDDDRLRCLRVTVVLGLV